MHLLNLLKEIVDTKMKCYFIKNYRNLIGNGQITIKFIEKFDFGYDKILFGAIYFIPYVN